MFLLFGGVAFVIFAVGLLVAVDFVVGVAFSVQLVPFGCCFVGVVVVGSSAVKSVISSLSLLVGVVIVVVGFGAFFTVAFSFGVVEVAVGGVVAAVGVVAVVAVVVFVGVVFTYCLSTNSSDASSSLELSILIINMLSLLLLLLYCAAGLRCCVVMCFYGTLLYVLCGCIVCMYLIRHHYWMSHHHCLQLIRHHPCGFYAF